jgi:hypothetical protein
LSALAPALAAALLASGGAVDEIGQIAKAEAALKGTTLDEKSVLALAGQRARRKGKALVLILDNGRALHLIDDDNCVPDDPEHADCPSYALAAFLPAHGVFVLRAEYAEAYDFVLVETANGIQHKIDGPPHYSPDGKRFLTCRVDEMNGGGAAIWRVAPGRYVQEWKDGHNSICGGWKNNDTVGIGFFGIGAFDDVPGGKPRQVEAVRNGKSWQLRGYNPVLKARP